MNTKWKKEEGTVLVVTMVITLALVVIGTLASMQTNVELDITKNDRFGKEAFFVADAGNPITSKVLEEMILNEGINPSNYPGVSFETNLLNEVRNYYEDDSDLNDKITDTPENNPDIETTVSNRELDIDVDWRLRKAGHGGSLLFSMGYEGVGVDRSHGGVKTYYNIDAQGKASENSTAKIGAVYLSQ